MTCGAECARDGIPCEHTAEPWTRAGLRGIFHACCGARETMQEMVFNEHTCIRTMRTMAMAVRTMLEGGDK